MDLETEAYNFALRKHSGQKYGKKPYSWHLESVVNTLDSMLDKTDELWETYFVVAWLHDILEDTDTTIEELYSLGLDTTMVDAIVAITHYDGETREEYIDRVKSDPIAWKVKIADTLSNLEHSVYDNHVRRINKYTKQLQKLYEG